MADISEEEVEEYCEAEKRLEYYKQNYLVCTNCNALVKKEDKAGTLFKGADCPFTIPDEKMIHPNTDCPGVLISIERDFHTRGGGIERGLKIKKKNGNN